MEACRSDISTFCSQCLKGPSSLYVSSTASNSTAVTGPPSIRARFWSNSPLPKSSFHRDLPIYGPYHAPHLFTSDGNDVLSEKTITVLNQYSQIHPVCDTSLSTSGLLFENSIDKILKETVDWNGLVKSCSSAIVESASPACRILAFGATPIGSTLSSSLKNLVSNGLKLSLDDNNSWLLSNPVPSYLTENPAGCNIAIVGMAGRFPDAADHEAFWDLLSKGLDVHRVVCTALRNNW